MKLLYLGFAFPPGIAGLFPDLQPAGHLVETAMIGALQAHVELRSVGILGVDLDRLPRSRDDSPGLLHSLCLVDRPPEILHRWRALARLRRAYVEWGRAGWRPDVVLTYNMSPVYNAFVRWLKRQSDAPKCVLYLADSTQLGLPMSRAKRFRYRFKPLVWLDDEMLGWFDACVAVSPGTEARFRSRGRPWLWQPSGCDPTRVRRSAVGPAGGPIVFGYVGAASDYAGAPHLLRVFTAGPRTAALQVCSYGKSRHPIEAAYAGQRNVTFHGPRKPDGCLDLSLACDVMVNPRPPWPGNENNFPSKVFEYALSGRAILTSRLAGVDAVLGDEAFYFDVRDFDRNLDRAFGEIAELPRAELQRRGAAIQARVVQNFSWERQARRLAEFLQRVVAQGAVSLA